MSLVAYESSDDSEHDDDKEMPQENPKLPSNIDQPITSISTTDNKSDIKVGLFSKLPPPKRPSTSPIEVTNEDPIPCKVTRKEPVKIVLPSLREFEDDEEDKIKKDKRKPAVSGSGLIGILPEPQHFSLKTSNLIPYTLTRKPVPKKTAIPKPKLSTSPVVKELPEALPQDEPNSDDENITDFFSLAQTDKVVAVPTMPSTANDATTKLDEAFNRAANAELDPSPFSNNALGAQNLASDLNLNFPSTDYANPDASGMTEGNFPSYGPSYPTGDATTLDWSSLPSPSSEPDLLQNAALMRLAGKKQSSRENIQLVEVKGDDLVAGRNEWLLKSLSEEHGYQSVSKKSEQPSAAHRRKHQITYLAFQAKAREQELKNQWAMNRMTKRQTQSKYGF